MVIEKKNVIYSNAWDLCLSNIRIESIKYKLFIALTKVKKRTYKEFKFIDLNNNVFCD